MTDRAAALKADNNSCGDAAGGVVRGNDVLRFRSESMVCAGTMFVCDPVVMCVAAGGGRSSMSMLIWEKEESASHACHGTDVVMFDAGTHS